jgi:hypothetical protein
VSKSLTVKLITILVWLVPAFGYVSTRGIMKRRKYLAGIGSIAAGGALAVSTSASIDVWANRTAEINVVRDGEAFLNLAPGEENGHFVDTGDGDISIDFSGASGAGFNQAARSTVDDLFRIENQTGDTQVVWIKDADENDAVGDLGPINFFRGPVRVTGQDRFQIVSAIERVPGTPATEQRVSVTGLVPPNGLRDTLPDGATPLPPRHPLPDGFDPAQLWVKTGASVLNTETNEFRLNPRANIPYTPGGVEAGTNEGRLVLDPGESMHVGLDVDFENTDDDASDRDVSVDEMQIVSRPVDDALGLATGDTEFSNESA